MSKLIIQGGVPIAGTHVVPGNKNAALPMLAATLLASEPVTLENVPNIADVRVMIEGLRELGARVEADLAKSHTVTVDPSRLKAVPELSAATCARIRTSILFAGPLLARKGRLRLRAAPGGDSIGRRRLDTHFAGFHALGATGRPRPSGAITLKAPQGLVGAYFMLDEASVTATENLVMAAVMALGPTTLYNVACEPHVQNLCRMLCGMGAKIEGIGTNRLTIEGVPRLCGGCFRVGGDAIEAASYLVAAAVTGGALTLKGVDREEMAVLRPAFARFGVRWSFDEAGNLRLPAKQALKTAYDLGAAIPQISNGPWPALPSDLMSVLIVLATQTRGTELFFEKMFESRLYFVDHLIGMGARIVQCDPHRAVVTGPTTLQGCTVSSPDIRAGIALIIAALCARGTTEILNAESIDRGYETIEENLRALGANIRRA
ncbi:MAG: UDP-N-acetylglucosamine 1-carboxyvinyltransferase [Candidatus Spyradenecus sp.]